MIHLARSRLTAGASFGQYRASHEQVEALRHELRVAGHNRHGVRGARRYRARHEGGVQTHGRTDGADLEPRVLGVHGGDFHQRRARGSRRHAHAARDVRARLRGRCGAGAARTVPDGAGGIHLRHDRDDVALRGILHHGPVPGPGRRRDQSVDRHDLQRREDQVVEPAARLVAGRHDHRRTARVCADQRRRGRGRSSCR